MPTPRRVHSLYVPDNLRPVMDEYKELANKANVSVDSLIWATMQACLPTYRKDLLEKRTLTLNGRKVIV